MITFNNLTDDRLAITLACIGDGVISTDIQGKINFMNSSAEDLTGWKAADAYGKDFEQIFTIINILTKEKLPNPIVNAMETGSAVGLKNHSVLITKSGTRRYLSASCSPIKDVNGELAGAVVAFRDITRRKVAEIELKRAKEAAEAANKAKSEFLANMSHEIRTPLNGIVGMLDLTLLTPLSYEQKDNLLIAKTCANSLLKVINDVLDFSKMEAGKLVMEEINFNIKELVEEIVKAHSPQAANKNLELNYTFSSNAPEFVVGDPNRLKQILNNLIGNALKFTEQGKVVVSVKQRSATAELMELKFAIEDTGIGIAEEDRGKLFQSFSQVDSSFTRKYGGTGLGLVISKQLVEMMEGTMWVESEKEKGSTFFFTVKLKPGQIEQPRTAEKVLANFHCLRILLVEDDELNQMVMERMLKERGHIVEIANNGQEAVLMFQQKKYDVILMDIQMPEMDGIEATKKIREKAKRHIPIIALTAYALKGDKEKFIALGMDDYLAKPIKMEELLQRLDAICRDKGVKPEFIPNGIRVSANGEIIFLEKKERPFSTNHLPILTEISENVEKIGAVLTNSDLPAIENLAHKIKNLANGIDLEEVKTTAFKIELAARRANLDEIIQYVRQIGQQLATYKKSIN